MNTLRHGVHQMYAQTAKSGEWRSIQYNGGCGEAALAPNKTPLLGQAAALLVTRLIA
jgi:hypothetical protein